jgi:PAS domain S-box-containing protein
MTIPAPVSGRMASTPPEIDFSRAIEWLHLALEAGKSVGWDWDVKSGRDSWFGDLETMFGIPSKTYVGHVEDFRRRVYPDDRPVVWKAVQEAMQDHTPYTAEFRILRPDGVIRWVAAKGKFYYSPDGEAERMVGVAVDITERKAVEEALRQKKIELTEAQRLAGVGSWQWNPETGAVFWSDETYRIAGRDPNLPAVRYKEDPNLYTKESEERLERAVEECLRSGTPYELELEMNRPDGTTRWLISRGEPQRDSTGRIVGLRGTVQDITDRRQSREALRESEERLRLAAQAGRMYAYEWDRATDVIVRSAEFAHILGLASGPKTTTCQEMLETVHPDDREKVVAATQGCTPENPNCRIRYRVLRSDGSVVWLEKNAHAFFDRNGEMVRMVGMVADINERKLAEDAISNVSRRLIDAQETERARIARDLHDDIGQRLALLSLTLEQTKLVAVEADPEVRSRLNELRKQILVISSAVHTLSHELHSSSLRYLHVVKAMRGLCAERSKQHNVEISFAHKDIPETVPEEISLCLFRVLQEALHNAVRHSEARSFDVKLSGTYGGLDLVVSDSGRGFDLAEVTNGRGLGLSSMQERLKLLDGSLSIDSQPGQGTTIHAHVPLTVAQALVQGAGK